MWNNTTRKLHRTRRLDDTSGSDERVRLPILDRQRRRPDADFDLDAGLDRAGQRDPFDGVDRIGSSTAVA
jgi:hypothetical protein